MLCFLLQVYLRHVSFWSVEWVRREQASEVSNRISGPIHHTQTELPPSLQKVEEDRARKQAEFLASIGRGGGMAHQAHAHPPPPSSSGGGGSGPGSPVKEAGRVARHSIAHVSGGIADQASPPLSLPPPLKHTSLHLGSVSTVPEEAAVTGGGGGGGGGGSEREHGNSRPERRNTMPAQPSTPVGGARGGAVAASFSTPARHGDDQDHHHPGCGRPLSLISPQMRAAVKSNWKQHCA